MQWGAIVGINYLDHTAAELLKMAQAKQRDAWNHSALIACLLANGNRDPKTRRRPFTVLDFHPFRDEFSGSGRGLPITRESIRAYVQAKQEQTKGRASV